jgi:hypothetical protein
VEDEIMVKGLKEVWDRRPHAHLKNGRILVSDAHMGHIIEKVKTLTLKQRQCTISLKAAVLPGLISGRALVKKKKTEMYFSYHKQLPK